MRSAIGTAVFALLGPAAVPAEAHLPHWGVSFSLVPSWTSKPDSVKVAADQVLEPFGTDIKMHPLFESEVAGSDLAAPGLKIRVSGGFGWPGTTRFAIGLI